MMGRGGPSVPSSLSRLWSFMCVRMCFCEVLLCAATCIRCVSLFFLKWWSQANGPDCIAFNSSVPAALAKNKDYKETYKRPTETITMASEDILALVHLLVLELHLRETETTSVKLDVEFWLAHRFSLAIVKIWGTTARGRSASCLENCFLCCWCSATKGSSLHVRLNHSLWSWDKSCLIPTYLQLCC